MFLALKSSNLTQKLNHQLESDLYEVKKESAMGSEVKNTVIIMKIVLVKRHKV